MQYDTFVYVLSLMRRAAVVSLILFGCSGLRTLAQTSGGGSVPAARATPLPISAETGQSGAVGTEQTPVAGSGPATINSSVQVNGNFAGSVPAKDTPAGPLTLTLADAVKLGLTANLGAVTADNAARASRAARIQALSSLLPNIAANASDTVSQVSLAAFGFQFNVPASLGFSIPSVVGPFNYSSLQATLSQSVYDTTARRNWRATQETEKASLLNAKDAREVVVLAVGGSYLQVVATAARVDSQRAQVANAAAINRQAEVRREAGTNARIDVTRSAVELQTEQQRLSSLEAELQKEKIALARLIGLPQDRELTLTEPLSAKAGNLPDTNQAIQMAWQHRSDLKALEAGVRAAEIAVSAARAEYLPTASVSGNYGVIGPNPSTTHGVFTVIGTVSVPIWQGGRVKGDTLQAEATLDQRRAELANERGKVEQDVRTALIETAAAQGQVHLAESSRDLANETLQQARDRFGAGVATTLEVVQAQQQVASADSDAISSLFSYQLAKLALARAMGEAEETLTNKASEGQK